MERKLSPLVRGLVVFAALAALTALVIPLAASAQWDDYGDDDSDPYRAQSRSGSTGVSVRGAFGFTVDPETFEMGVGFPIRIVEDVAFTPHLLMGFDDDDTIVAPSLNLEVAFPLGDGGDDIMDRLSPYLQGGIGFAYIDRDRGGDNDDEIGFLLTPGLGIEYRITDNLHIGTNARFNVLPKETAGEHFFFSWEFFSVRIAF